METTIEAQVCVGDKVQVTKRQIEGGKVIRETFDAIVRELLVVEEVYRSGIGVVTKSRCHVEVC